MIDSSNLISIIVPVFNRKDIVIETIDSVKNQTYSNWELIIVDDGSIDGTSEHLLEIASKDKRIFFLQRDVVTKGAPSCRNIGIRKSVGKYIIFLDSDDILAPSCLEERLSYALLNPNMDFLVFPGLIFYDTPGDSQILWNIDKKTDDLVRFLQLDAPWQTSGTIWKSEAVKRNGFWDERLSSWQDMDYHTRALIKKIPYKKINKDPDFYYRIGNPGKISSNDKEIEQLYARIILAENMFKYLKGERDHFSQTYKKNLFNFFMWICLSFIKKKHFNGVSNVIKSLYKLKIIGIFTKFIYLFMMKINFYFFHTSYKKSIGKIIRQLWHITIYNYFFEEVPPINHTVKMIEFEKKSIKDNIYGF